MWKKMILVLVVYTLLFGIMAFLFGVVGDSRTDELAASTVGDTICIDGVYAAGDGGGYATVRYPAKGPHRNTMALMAPMCRVLPGGTFTSIFAEDGVILVRYEAPNRAEFPVDCLTGGFLLLTQEVWDAWPRSAEACPSDN